MTPADLFTADQATFWDLVLASSYFRRQFIGFWWATTAISVETTQEERNIHEVDVHFKVGDVRRGRLHLAMTLRSRRGEEDAGQRHPLKRARELEFDLIKASSAALFSTTQGVVGV